MTDQDASLLLELRGTLGKMERVLAAVHDAIGWIDDAGRLRWCNAAFDRLVGRPHIEILGGNAAELLPLERHGARVAGADHPLSPRRPVASSAEVFELRRDGELAALELVVREVSLTDGPTRVFTVRDVTEVERAGELLEQRVQERTRELEQVNAQLREGLAWRVRAEATIRELSTPVLRVRDGLLLAPLVGALDEARARQLAEQALSALSATRAAAVVIDVTGVPALAPAAFQRMAHLFESVRLLGAVPILTGVRPEVAMAWAELGGLPSAACAEVDLQRGIEVADREQRRRG